MENKIRPGNVSVNSYISSEKKEAEQTDKSDSQADKKTDRQTDTITTNKEADRQSDGGIDMHRQLIRH